MGLYLSVSFYLATFGTLLDLQTVTIGLSKFFDLDLTKFQAQDFDVIQD